MMLVLEGEEEEEEEGKEDMAGIGITYQADVGENIVDAVELGPTESLDGSHQEG